MAPGVIPFSSLPRVTVLSGRAGRKREVSGSTARASSICGPYPALGFANQLLSAA
jgi:hypothetical protein